VSRFPFQPAFVLAPMEGVTSPAMRQLIAGYGPIGLVCTEFVRIAGDSISPQRLADTVRKAPNVALSVQVMGNNDELMAEAGGVIGAAGADVVDVNLGCPTRTAVSKGVGAALLRDPLRLSRLLSSMRSKVKGLFSAKLRAGFEGTDEALTNARIVEACGADFLTIHPRRRVDFYQGVADWRIVSRVREDLRIPVVGNGDVWYAASALRLMEQTGCDAVMIGRPAFRNPWLFRQISELMAGRSPFAPSGADLAAHFRAIHRELSVDLKRAPQVLIGPLKEQLTYLCRSVPGNGDVKRRLLRSQTVEELLDATEEVFSPLMPDQLDLDAHGRLALERPGTLL
jgi:nifR3 family TIM-barrel protein